MVTSLLVITLDYVYQVAIGTLVHHHVLEVTAVILVFKLNDMIFFLTACPSLFVPPGRVGNLTVSVDNTIVDSTAVYSCTLPGFTIIGVDTRVCQFNRLWSGLEPFCAGVYMHKVYKIS